MMLQMQFGTLLAFISICQVLSQVPDSMPAPTVDSILATSFTVKFQSVVGASKYYVTVTPRHVGTTPKPLETLTLTANVQDLTENSIYYVSVQAENTFGIGGVGDMIEVRTLPRLRNLHLGKPLPNAVDIFFNMKCGVEITIWSVEYHITSSSNVTTLNATTTYTYRISELEPDTPYRIRACPRELDGTTLPESEELCSNWEPFTTDTLSIFGSVVLTNVTYTPNHQNEYGPEWNSSLEIIEDGYSSISNNGISLIGIEDGDGGNALIHYRVKVKDKSLPSPTDFRLTGTDFTASVINNGGKAVGTPYIYKTGDAWTLIYSSTSSCPKLVERYMKVTPDDESTFEIHLNVASSAATTSEEDDALRVKSDGRLVTDDGVTARTVSLNTVLVLSPRFLVKDCLIGGGTTSVYSEYFVATDANDMPNLITNIEEMTGYEPLSSVFNETAVTYTSSFNGTSVILSIPAVAEAIKYKVFNSSGAVVSTLYESDTDCSDFLKQPVDSLENGTTYTFNIEITTRGVNGASSSFTTKSFNVTPIATMVTTLPNPTTTGEASTLAPGTTSAAKEILSTVVSTPTAATTAMTTSNLITTGEASTLAPGTTSAAKEILSTVVSTPTAATTAMTTSNLITTGEASTVASETTSAAPTTSAANTITSIAPLSTTVLLTTSSASTTVSAFTTSTNITTSVSIPDPLPPLSTTVLPTITSASTTVSAFTTFTNTTTSVSIPELFVESGLPVWALILIIVFSVFILGGIIAVLVWYFCVARPPKRCDDRSTGNGATIYVTDRII